MIIEDNKFASYFWGFLFLSFSESLLVQPRISLILTGKAWLTLAIGMNEATGMFTLLYISLLVHPVIRDSHAGFVAFTGPNSLFNAPILSIFWWYFMLCKVCPIREPLHIVWLVGPQGSGGCVFDLPLVPFSIYFHEIVVSVQLSYTDTRYKIG